MITKKQLLNMLASALAEAPPSQFGMSHEESRELADDICSDSVEIEGYKKLQAQNPEDAPAKIGIKCNDGSCVVVQCQHEGSLGETGIILAKHYKTSERVESLMSLGKLSHVGEKISCDLDSDDKSNVCIACHRDCGEPLETPEIYDSVEDLVKNARACNIDHVYLYDAESFSWKYFPSIDRVDDNVISECKNNNIGVWIIL